MTEHKFKPISGLVSAREVVGNIAASEDKLREGEEIARQLEEDFGRGQDLAVRVGYPDVDAMRGAVSRLEAVTQIKDQLERNCEEVKDDLESNVEALRRLLLPLVVTDIPAALEKFPSLKDVLSGDLVATRQTQICSGDVDNEQLEDLQEQVKLLELRCDKEVSGVEEHAKGREEAESRLEAARKEVDRLKKRLETKRHELEDARGATTTMKDQLDMLGHRARGLEQKLSSEEDRAARYKRELDSVRADLRVTEETVANHETTVQSMREQLATLMQKNSTTQESRLGSIHLLERSLKSEKRAHEASRVSHAKAVDELKSNHQSVVDFMQGQVDELRSENNKARSEISGKDTELRKSLYERGRLQHRAERLRAKLDDSKKYLGRARADMQEARDQAEEIAREKEAILGDKQQGLDEANEELAEKDHQLELSMETAARLRKERNELRASNKTMAASSGGLKQAELRVTELEEATRELKLKFGESEWKLQLASSAKQLADANLREKERQQRQAGRDLSQKSKEVRRLKDDLSSLRGQHEATLEEQEALRDEVDRLERLVTYRDNTLDEKSATIERQAEEVGDLKSQAIITKVNFDAEMEESKCQLRSAEGRLEEMEQELNGAREGREQALDDLSGMQELNDSHETRIKSLEGELVGLQASSSASTKEIAENNRQVSLFLADMAGAAPDMWAILRSWNGIPADLAVATGEPQGPPSLDASLQMDVVLLLGEAASKKLNTERSQAVLAGLITSVGSTSTRLMPMGILTELVDKVAVALREVAHTQVEFALAFWQLMELVEHRIGRQVPEDPPWQEHKRSLSHWLEQHPCALVFDILREKVDLRRHDLCRLFGDSVGLCSHRGWKSAVLFDIDSRSLRFVDKALVSMHRLDTLRVGPEPGHDAVDLQLQPPDLIWQMMNI
ncbi:hypothetical protein INS49_013757 [Diaporthe citri]|uniref:uncharacterized protein n=1 Tax=Diaporthe citri TaxID=83186 RepID=UPI001C7F50A8|nr:uncharacterized protein INS49_013757 [Diaporthe citri]KAG6357874.1 hypothetical protein INS49_013757 [Diaporthe citri]